MEFPDIALAKLLQTQPDLGQLILTFQDVSEEITDDTGIQVGVFVLRSGPDLFYVPVVSKADNVYPIDSIFFDARKKFFPLTKKTISRIVASSQLEQGKPTKIPSTVNVNPSIQGIITPPRTGKYAYASASRLTDFLAALPNHLKQYTFEKFAAEKSVYDELDRMFSLKAIFDVLKPTPVGAPAIINQAPVSVVTGAGPQIDEDIIQSILRDGYHLTGASPTSRVALSVQDYNQGGVVREVCSADANADYELAFNQGPSREAFLAPMHSLSGGNSLAVFTNGDYAVGHSFITVGDPLLRREVLTRLFDYVPPILLSDVSVGDTFTISTSSNTFIGPFTANKVILSNLGVEIAVGGGHGFGVNKVCGYRNFQGEAQTDSHLLYVPSSSIVLRLGTNVSGDLALSVNAAAARKQFEVLQYLGTEINLGFDGVEYSINGKPVGGEPSVMSILVSKEGINPNQAQSFIKQAQETKFTKIFLSKQAAISSDATPADIPNYGAVPADSPDIKPNGAYNPNLVQGVQKAMPLKDGQVTESVIISELLQVPDMMEQISEYLPDIEESIDKLGRILFMSRVHINRLTESSDSEGVFGFLAQLKAVYRMLGDNYIKLEEMVAGAQTNASSYEPEA
jgi:hypothetical protein